MATTQNEYLNEFIIDATEMIDQLENKCHLLEEHHNSSEVAHELFRIIHSLKGMVSYFNLPHFTSIIHLTENLLDLFRSSSHEVEPEDTSLLYVIIDNFNHCIKVVQETNNDSNAEKECKNLIKKIEDRISAHNQLDEQNGNGSQPVKINLSNPNTKEQPPISQRESNSNGKSLEATMLEETQSESYKYQSELEKKLCTLLNKDSYGKYMVDTLDLMEKIDQTLFDLEYEKENKEHINTLFRYVHTMKGNAGFIQHESIENICMEIEAKLDYYRQESVNISNVFISELYNYFDNLRSIITSCSNQFDPLPILEGLEQDSESYGEHDTSISNDDAKNHQPSIHLTGDTDSREQPSQKAFTMEKAGSDSFRVNSGKLDKLFDLVGELITTESMLINLYNQSGKVIDNFANTFSTLNKISREMQEVIMEVRMVPIENLFIKMNRLVRTLSHDFKKPVKLIMSGQKTEVDKKVIEEISNPLVHIIRNAIDHGIEDAATRKTQGKSEEAQIQLSASHIGNEIWVSVEDDGQGFQRDTILKKAMENNLVTKDPDILTDEEVWNITFQPAFSTATKVTNISGRGVGMDVVRKNIEKLRGTIELKSTPSKGSKITLKIPLTLAIVDGITVKAGNNMYSIPSVDIHEFFQIKPRQLTHAEDGSEIIDWRNRMLPVIRLHNLINGKANGTRLNDGTIIVVRGGSKLACLFIDEIVGTHQIVIKPLSQYLGKVKGLTGCSILGDGTVSFVIDTPSLISRVIH